MRRLYLCVGALSLAMAAAAANAAVINVNLASLGQAGALDTTSSNTSTVAPAAYTGTTWTDTPLSIFAGTGTNLPDSNNNTTGIGFVVGGTYNPTATWYDSTWGGPIKMLSGGLYDTFSGMTVTLTGLSPTTQYDLNFASAVGLNSSYQTSFDITTGTGGGGLQTAFGGNNSTWALGQNYVHFTNVTPDISGDIVVTMSIVGGGAQILNGFQISSAGVSVPEPASLAIIGLGGLALLVRRRRVV